MRGGRLVHAAAAALLAGGAAAHVMAGVGPGGAYAASPGPDAHAQLAAAFAAAIPRQAAVSATPVLFPRVSQRERVYVFPAVADADYVFVDVTASPAPTSAGDIFLRVQTLLGSGWQVEHAEDGLLLLTRASEAQASGMDQIPRPFFSFMSPQMPGEVTAPGTDPIATYLDGALDLLHAEFTPSPAGTLAPREPRGTLRTIWRANRAVPPDAWPAFHFEATDGNIDRRADIAALWWHPPARWTAGEPMRIDVLSVPMNVRWWVQF